MAGETTRELTLVARLRDLASREARTLGGVVERESKRMEGAWSRARRGADRFGRAIRNVGRFVRGLVPGMGLLVGALGGILGFTAAARAASEFGKAMAEVSTLVDTAAVDMVGLREGVIGVAKEFGAPTADVARGLYQVISSGAVDAANSVGLLETAQALATAGVASTFEAVDILTTALSAFGLGAEEAGRVSDVLFETVRQGKTTIPELAGGLGQVIPIAAALGIGLEETTAAVAALTLAGLRTDIAITSLRGAFSALLKPGDDAVKVLRRYRIDASRARIESDGFVAVLAEIEQKLGGNEKALTALFPDIRSIAGIFALTGAQFEAFNRILVANQNALGSTGIALQKQLAEPAVRAQIAINRLRIVGERLGDLVIGGFLQGIEETGGIDRLETRLGSLAKVLGGVFSEGVVTIARLGVGVDKLVDQLGGPEKVVKTIVQGFELLGETIRTVFEVAGRAVLLLVESVQELVRMLGGIRVPDVFLTETARVARAVEEGEMRRLELTRLVERARRGEIEETFKALAKPQSLLQVLDLPIGTLADIVPQGARRERLVRREEELKQTLPIDFDVAELSPEVRAELGRLREEIGAIDENIANMVASLRDANDVKLDKARAELEALPFARTAEEAKGLSARFDELFTRVARFAGGIPDVELEPRVTSASVQLTGEEQREIQFAVKLRELDSAEVQAVRSEVDRVLSQPFQVTVEAPDLGRLQAELERAVQPFEIATPPADVLGVGELDIRASIERELADPFSVQFTPVDLGAISEALNRELSPLHDQELVFTGRFVDDAAQDFFDQIQLEIARLTQPQEVIMRFELDAAKRQIEELAGTDLEASVIAEALNELFRIRTTLLADDRATRTQKELVEIQKELNRGLDGQVIGIRAALAERERELALALKTSEIDISTREELLRLERRLATQREDSARREAARARVSGLLQVAGQLPVSQTLRAEIEIVGLEQARSQLVEQLELAKALPSEIDAVNRAYVRLADELRPETFQRLAGAIRGAKDALREFADAARNTAAQAFELVSGTLRSVTDGFGTFFADVVSGAASSSDALRRWGEDVLRTIAETSARAAAMQVLAPVAAALGGAAPGEAEGQALIAAATQVGIELRQTTDFASFALITGGELAGQAILLASQQAAAALAQAQAAGAVPGAPAAAGVPGVPGVPLPPVPGVPIPVPEAGAAAAAVPGDIGAQLAEGAAAITAGGEAVAAGGQKAGGFLGQAGQSLLGGVQGVIGQLASALIGALFAEGGVVRGGIRSLTPLAAGGVVRGLAPIPAGAARAFGQTMPAYQAGGRVVRGPNLALIGEGSLAEAVVPLPDGRSIPVNMRFAGGQGGGAATTGAQRGPTMIDVAVAPTIQIEVTSGGGTAADRGDEVVRTLLEPRTQRRLRAALADALRRGADDVFRQAVKGA